MEKIKDNKTPNVPILRFPSFVKKWNTYTCSQLLNFYSTNSLSWENLNYISGTIKNIHYGIIHNGLATITKLENSNIPYINDNIELHNSTLCKNGDVVFADASEDTLDVAKAIEIVSINEEKIVCGLHTIHARDNKKLTCLGFKGYLFASVSFHNKIRRLAQGTKVYSISSKTFNNISISIPEIPEQQKIADFLTLIDERIATQNKIIEELKRLKNGLSNYLFNLNNDNNNIYGFTEILKNYLKTNMNNLPQYTIGKNGIVKIQEKSLNYDISRHSVFVAKSCILGIGINEIGISINTIGACSPIYKTYLINESIVYTEFLYYFAKYYFNNAKRFITKKSTRRDFEFENKELYKMRFNIPNLQKQKNQIKILISIDSKIKQEKDFLELIKKQKQYLLSNMFI